MPLVHQRKKRTFNPQSLTSIRDIFQACMCCASTGFFCLESNTHHTHARARGKPPPAVQPDVLCEQLLTRQDVRHG